MPHITPQKFGNVSLFLGRALPVGTLRWVYELVYNKKSHYQSAQTGRKYIPINITLHYLKLFWRCYNTNNYKGYYSQ